MYFKWNFSLPGFIQNSHTHAQGQTFSSNQAWQKPETRTQELESKTRISTAKSRLGNDRLTILINCFTTWVCVESPFTVSGVVWDER